MTRTLRTIAALLAALALVAAACGGSDDALDVGSEPAPTATPVGPSSEQETGDVEPTGEGGDDTADPATSGLAGDPPAPDVDDAQEPLDPDAPIPVEPDGGIGDGAGPLPGFEDEERPPAEDWHGAIVAETNCPGIDFQRVEASAFSFSVPVDFVDQEPQGIDSEVGSWSAGTVEASYDFGWYSSPLDNLPTAEVIDIDYSGFAGRLVIVRDAAVNIVGVHFPVVVQEDESPSDALTLVVRFADAADEIIGRCVVGSIEWDVSPPE